MNPFIVDTIAPHDYQNTKRREYTLNFITGLQGEILDLGSRSLLGEMLETKFVCKLRNTTGDLDEITLSGSYDFVLAFEVIEHLMNPLNLLLEVGRVLKPCGKLYLSTPINKPKFLWGKYHFHEFDEYRLGVLLERAGFRAVRKEIRRCTKLNGIRPLIRYLFNSGTILLELQKAS